jgi:hypothetical protein
MRLDGPAEQGRKKFALAAMSMSHEGGTRLPSPRCHRRLATLR